jgi:hypothetical protein
VQYLCKGIALHTILGDDSLQKDERTTFHVFLLVIMVFCIKQDEK